MAKHIETNRTSLIDPLPSETHQGLFLLNLVGAKILHLTPAVTVLKITRTLN